MQVQGMDWNSFFLDAIDHEAIKIGLMPAIRTAFLEMELSQKLPKPSSKSYVCEAYFLNLKFPLAKNFPSSPSAPSLKL